jgi:hypothetical protein
MKLFHDFKKIELNLPNIEIYEILAIEDYDLENELVKLILNKEFGIDTSWLTISYNEPNTQ